MKKLRVAALAISAFALASAHGATSATQDELEAACRQAAVDEGVPLDESADFIAECVEMNLESVAGEGDDVTEPAQQPVIPSE